MAARFFISQEALDGYVEAELASIDGERLNFAGRGLEAAVVPAMYFVREVEGKDDHGLVGKVRTIEAVVEQGGDHFRASVILGDNAYDVLEGYLGTAPEGWQWPGRPVAAPSVPDVPAPDVPADDDIPVVLEPPVAEAEPDPEPAPEAAPRPTGRRPSLAPAARDRLHSKPGFRAPAPPPSDAADEPVRPARTSRPPLPPGGAARASKPPPPPGSGRSTAPPLGPSAPSASKKGRKISPGETAQDLEKILLETIRPTRGKRR